MGLNRQRFCEKVSKVQKTREEVDYDLALFDTVADPIKSHVNALRFFRADRGSSKTYSALVITVDSSRRLRISEAG